MLLSFCVCFHHFMSCCVISRHVASFCVNLRQCVSICVCFRNFASICINLRIFASILGPGSGEKFGLAGTTPLGERLRATLKFHPPGRPSRKDESTPQGRFPDFTPTRLIMKCRVGVMVCVTHMQGTANMAMSG